MKLFIILFSFFSLLGHSQNNELNELFIKVPLNESRDSIYDFLLNSNHFSKEKPKYKIIHNSNFPKVYSGNLNKSISEFYTKNTDSINVQLTFGNVSIEGEKESKDLVVFYAYYYLSDSKSAISKLKNLEKRISKICKEKPYYYKNFRREENDIEEKYVGFSNQWDFKNKENLEIELKYEIIKHNEKYLIELKYSRYE